MEALQWGALLHHLHRKLREIMYYMRGNSLSLWEKIFNFFTSKVVGFRSKLAVMQLIFLYKILKICCPSMQVTIEEAWNDNSRISLFDWLTSQFLLSRLSNHIQSSPVQISLALQPRTACGSVLKTLVGVKREFHMNNIERFL